MGPPTQCGTLGTPVQDADIYRGDVVMARFVKPGHHSMYLVWVGAMYREVCWAITETKNEKEPQHNLCAAPNCHLDGGSYCDSASPRTLYEILTLYDFLTLPYL